MYTHYIYGVPIPPIALMASLAMRSSPPYSSGEYARVRARTSCRRGRGDIHNFTKPHRTIPLASTSCNAYGNYT